MSDYQNSERHINNAKKASLIALSSKEMCSFCKKEFVRANHKKHENSCFENPKNLKECEICKEKFFPYKHKKNKSPQKTCGTSCANKLRNFKSINHPNHKKSKHFGLKEFVISGFLYRSICFEHHKKECVVCGENIIIDVHHLDENKKNNNPENLIPLCPNHHVYWHSKNRHLIEHKVMEYLKKWKEVNNFC